MSIDQIPVPPVRDLSNPQQVGRLMNYLHEQSVAMQRLADITEVPTAPTLITVRQGAGKIVEIEATFTEPEGWTTTEFYRNTSNNSATATLIDSKRGHIAHDTNVSYATTYYYWAKVVVSAATSAFSPVGSITVSKVVTGDVTALAITSVELASNAVTTEKITDANVTTAKRQNQSYLDVGYTVGANSVTTVTFNHNLGVIPSYVIMFTTNISDWPASSKASTPIYGVSTTSLVVLLWNSTGSSVTSTARLYYW